MTSQTITTRYLSPTTHRGARVKATTSSGITHTVPYDHQLSDPANAMACAKALAEAMAWPGRWHMGQMAPDRFAFVLDRAGEKFDVFPAS